MSFSGNTSVKPRFFSKDNFDKIAKSVKSMLPMLRSGKEKIEAEFGLTEVHGVGFLQDFRVYSKIEAKHWANASPVLAGGQSGQLTAIQSNNLGVYVSGAVTGTGSTITTAVGSGTSAYYQQILNAPQAALMLTNTNDGAQLLDHDVTLPAAAEAVEAAAVDESALLSPVQVFRELERVPTAFSLMDIDKKAALYNSVVACIRSDAGGGIKNTLKDVQRRVNARCRYRDSKEVRAFFDQYQTTTCDAINKLLEKYQHLKIGPADDFIPEMPDDALETMVKYTKMTVKVTGEKPVFYLIAPDAEFKKKKEVRQKRDPILLVQAPFGFYWQILGAWGPEMVLLEEI